MSILNYKNILDEPFLLKKYTGFSQKEFGSILKSFELIYKTYHQESNLKIGRSSKLDICDKLLFILFFYRFNPSQKTLSSIFGISEAQTNYWLGILKPIIDQSLGYNLVFYNPKTQTIKQMSKKLPELF